MLYSLYKMDKIPRKYAGNQKYLVSEDKISILYYICKFMTFDP